MRIAVCTPAHGDTKAEFTFSLASMVASAAKAHELTFVLGSGSILPRVRNGLVERALEQYPDYLLWLDSDHTFPHWTLERLLSHDLPVVGCNYVRRTFGEGTTAFRNGEQVSSGSGVEPVDVIGLGVCLIRADLFRAVPKPWFAFVGDDGEDVFFFKQLRAVTRIRPHVDHDLSARVGHIASQILFLG